MNNKHLISITDLSIDQYLTILDYAARFEKNPNQPLLKGKVVGSLFFEPSTRTRLSFETAIKRMGGEVIGFSDSSSTSATKGESLHDTIKMVSGYTDMIVMRHPLEGSSRYASEVSTVPVINAGDGANQHPTQTMLDLYSILKTQKTLDNLNIGMVGDLKYGRTVHSLLQAISQFKNPTFNFVAPPKLALPLEYKEFMDKNGINYNEFTEMEPIIDESDIIYMTRIQRERFNDPMDYEKVKNVYTLNIEMLKDSKDNLKVLHPLPRVNEISTDVDSSDKAYYFDQAVNGMYTRMGIIAYLLGLEPAK